MDVFAPLISKRGDANPFYYLNLSGCGIECSGAKLLLDCINLKRKGPAGTANGIGSTTTVTTVIYWLDLQFNPIYNWKLHDSPAPGWKNPLNILRELRKDGVIGEVEGLDEHPEFFEK